MEITMESSNENSWKGLVPPLFLQAYRQARSGTAHPRSAVRALVPPALLRAYRQARYGNAYRRSNLSVIDRLAIEAKDIQFSLPSRPLNDLLPGIDSVLVTAPVTELYRPRDMVVPLAEVLTLAAICRHQQPRRIFEIGTHTGSSTLVMAINVADDTEILTLDLAPSETVGSAYRNTDYTSRIRQLYGDSKTFDYTPFLGKMDFVFIDADHTYESVKADTEKAFALLRPGGVIVWDDYRWLDVHVECVGVTLFLNEFGKTRSVFNIAGTRFGIYVDQKPGDDRRS
jgi:predicted O-methyltransferase YrrM